MSTLLLLLLNFGLTLDVGEKVQIRHAGYVSMASDGSFLVNGWLNLYHFDGEGTLINKVGGHLIERLGVGFWDPNQKLYWLVDRNAGETLFFDDRGAFIGNAYHDGSRQVIFRQLFQTPDGIYSSLWTRRLSLQRERPKILQKVSIHVGDDKVLLDYSGPKFRRITARASKLGDNFKKHWLVVTEPGGSIHVMDELEPKVWHFKPENLNDDIPPAYTYLSLENFTDAPESVPQVPDFEFEPWWSSWSRITGFYAYKTGYVVGYSPSVKSEEDKARVILQRLNDGMKPIGNPQNMPGHLIGVFRDKVYLVSDEKQESGVYRVRGIAL